MGREKIVLKKREIYPVNSRFYYYDNSQQLISTGNFRNETKEIYFQIKGKDITFQVIDGETKESIPRITSTLRSSVIYFRLSMNSTKRSGH